MTIVLPSGTVSCPIFSIWDFLPWNLAVVGAKVLFTQSVPNAYLQSGLPLATYSTAKLRCSLRKVRRERRGGGTLSKDCSFPIEEHSQTPFQMTCFPAVDLISYITASLTERKILVVHYIREFLS